jgi:hypothetical protein
MFLYEAYLFLLKLSNPFCDLCNESLLNIQMPSNQRFCCRLTGVFAVKVEVIYVVYWRVLNCVIYFLRYRSDTRESKIQILST